MHRLVETMRSDSFLAAHPVLQASYAHYGLVAIHPFADGNGRVARALASIFTYRAHGAPVLVLAENRDQYFSTLEIADTGQWQRFVDFVYERSVDAIRLVHDSFRAAKYPPLEQSLERLAGVFTTRGGYGHEEVDQAGITLMGLLAKEVRGRRLSGQARIAVAVPTTDGTEPRPGYRRLVSGEPRILELTLTSPPPAKANVHRRFVIEVPQDCGKHDDFVIRSLGMEEFYEARATELMPLPSAALQMRIPMWVDGILGNALNELERKAAASLKSRGY
jgi:hypothetical protein